MPDGEHVLGVVNVRQADVRDTQASEITVVLNWVEELKARVSAK